MTVLDSIRRWQTKLLQLDRRNSLLYFSPEKRGVRLTEIAPDALLLKLSETRGGLSFPYVETRRNRRDLFAYREDPQTEGTEPADVVVLPGDLDTALAPKELQKRLNTIAKRAKEWQEEQGLSVQFLALGFLHWRDADSEPAISPLLLTPTTLRRTSPRDPWHLLVDDVEDIQVNATLRHSLKSTANIDLPEYSTESLEAYFSEIERLVESHSDWYVERSAVLATFPYSKLAMWADLEAMLTDDNLHPLVRRLAGDSTTQLQTEGTEPDPLWDDDRLLGAGLDDLLNIKDQYTVVDADFSQLRAIERSRTGSHLVIHGPPGTGKSQTIANIIATALAERKSVLFVSEKTAALDVVKRRLSEVGLGSLCLDLHSTRAQKASVYQQLNESLQSSASPASSYSFEKLQRARTTLNEVVRELHAVRDPLGLSVFDVHGTIAQLGDIPSARLTASYRGDLSGSQYAAIRQAVQRLLVRPREFAAHKTSHWQALNDLFPSPTLSGSITSTLSELDAALDEIILASLAVTSFTGLSPVETLQDAKCLRATVDHFRSRPDPIPASMATAEGLTAANNAAQSLRGAQAHRTALRTKLGSVFSNIPEGSLAQGALTGVEFLLGQAREWTELLGDTWTTLVLSEPGNVAQRANDTSLAVEGLISAGEALERTLNLPEASQSFSGINSTISTAKAIRITGILPRAWGSKDEIKRISRLLNEASLTAKGVLDAERDLLSRFDASILEGVDQALLARFRTDYRSPFFWLNGTYWRDKKRLQGYMQSPQDWKRTQAVKDIELALELKRLRTDWTAVETRASEQLGQLFEGLHTDWSGVIARVAAADSLYRSGHLDDESIASLLTDPSCQAVVARALADCESRRDVFLSQWRLLSERTPEDLSAIYTGIQRFASCVNAIADAHKLIRSADRPPLDLNELRDWLVSLAQLHDLEAAHREREGQLEILLGSLFQGWDTKTERVDGAILWAQQLARLAPQPWPEKLRMLLASSQLVPALTETCEHLITSHTRLQGCFAKINEVFSEERTPWGSWLGPSVQLLRSWVRALAGDAPSALAWLEYRTAVRDVEQHFAPGLIDEVRALTDQAQVAAALIERHVLLTWLDSVTRSSPALQLAPVDLSALAAEFRSLDSLFPKYARERVREACITPIAGLSHQQNHGELGLLNRELSKRRRQLPVRKLVSSIPNVLQVLKPCFMMSPLAVSQYLPRGNSSASTLTFDLTIFDEASQVFPEDAVPALARARQAIVVGDQQQLPPTGFFRGDIEEEVSEDEEGTDDRLADVESILDALVGMRGAGVADVYLEVHYRSQHDSLIRFSNHYFYDDRLLTFPAAARTQRGLGVRGVYVPEGRFDSGASQTNRIEAEHLVAELFTLLDERGLDQSIGVVALSRAQADCIQQLIDQRRVTDRRYDAFFADDRRERFFVKNLENVQGDERDHILISVGYGPTTASQVVPNRFGPINSEGGHRRLNVAVSRARLSVTVMHSLRPEDIRSDRRGPRLLRRYLEFVRDGDVAIEGEVSTTQGGAAESPFEEAVGRALESRGYRIARQVGCAKFWVDMAIYAEDGMAFDLAIECDGKAFHSSPSARDRDRIRQEVLERLGWRGRIHRVWSSAWIRNPKAELDVIEEALARARALPRGVRPEVRTEPTTDSLADKSSDSSTPTSIGRPQAEISPAGSPGFEPYVYANLRRFGSGRDLREEAPSKLASLVTAVVDTEGPILDDVIIDRVRTHYGLSRAGVNVRKAIQDGIDSAVERRLINVLGKDADLAKPVFHTAAGSAVLNPRAAAADGSLRKIDQIPHQEIEAGVISVLRLLVASSQSDLVEATARAFGFARTGEAVHARLSSAIGRLQAAGRLTERMGSLVLSE